MSNTPTQVKHSWRATVRTTFQVVVALAAMWGVVVVTLGLGGLPWAAASVTVAAAITRLMALPQVDDFLTRFIPWLAATDDPEPIESEPEPTETEDERRFRELFGP